MLWKFLRWVACYNPALRARLSSVEFFKESFWRVVQTRWMWSHWLKTCCGEQDHVFFSSREVALQVLTCCVFGARVWRTKKKWKECSQGALYTWRNNRAIFPLFGRSCQELFTLVQSRTLMFVFFWLQTLRVWLPVWKLANGSTLNAVLCCVCSGTSVDIKVVFNS